MRLPFQAASKFYKLAKSFDLTGKLVDGVQLANFSLPIRVLQWNEAVDV